MKRLALYVFWEKEGLVREHVLYYLDGLKKVAEDIFLIANGKLEEKGEKVLKAQDVNILKRENIGLDFSAWKSAIDQIGVDKLAEYDELILCNCSCYGPIYPFAECFQKMEEEKCDFWGLYRHPEIKGLFPAHLQSYFLVLRKSILESNAFGDYWKELSVAADWNEAVRQETHFTKYFEDRGFVSSAYIQNDTYERLIDNPTVLLAHLLIKNERFPLLKKKAFTESYEWVIAHGNTSQGKETLELLKKHIDYPINFLLSDLLATTQGSLLRKALHHTFVLSEGMVPQTQIKEKVAIIVFSYYEDLVEEDIYYIQNMPLESEVYIVVVSDILKEVWEQKKYKLSGRCVDIRKQANRGRNENAYWLTCRDVIENYDFICVAHNKKTPSAKPAIKGHYFSRHCWDNILKSPAYVNSIIDLFRRRPELGILMPPTLVFADFDKCIFNREWAGNKDIALEIYKRLELHIPFDEHPDAPWGAMFWLRGKAMAPFYRYNWTIEDFPEEPIREPDGTILHALERMYPMIAQEAGYFSAWIMPESEAGVHFDNMYHLAKQKAAQLDFMSGSSAQSQPSVQNYDVHFKTIRRMIKAYLKKKWHKLFRKR